MIASYQLIKHQIVQHRYVIVSLGNEPSCHKTLLWDAFHGNKAWKWGEE